MTTAPDQLTPDPPTTPPRPAAPLSVDPADGAPRPSALPAGPRWLPRLLRQPPFRRFWSAQTISLFGDQISALALPLLAVLTLGATSTQMGLLTAAALLPNLLFSLLAGAWVDRCPHKRRIMIFTDVGRAVLLLAIPVCYLLDVLTINQLYVVAFLSGALAVLFEVSYSTLFVSLVPKRDYIEANTLLNGARAMSYVGGPSVGGVLVATLTAPIALIADAISYLGSAFLLTRINPVEPAPEQRAGLGLGQGLRFIARQPVIRATLAATATVNLFNYMFHALIVLFVVRELGVTAGLLGAVLGAGAIGALLGAAATGRLVRWIGVGPSFTLSCLLFPAPLLLVPLADGPMWLILAMLFAAEFISGLGVMVMDITIGSLWTSIIPDQLRARVAGAQRTINYGIRPIGAVIGGLVGEGLGLRPALWIATAGALLGVLWLLPSPVPGMRELPDTDDHAAA
jgi:MFS family permease